MLNEAEVRVLGSLIEKQVTTPEYYPLTLNALMQACNQRNNRDPVVSYDEATIAHALETLRTKNLVYVFYGSGSRVPKYKHMTAQVYELDEREQAVINVLMLRGQQTTGELRGWRTMLLASLPGAGTSPALARLTQLASVFKDIDKLRQISKRESIKFIGAGCRLLPGQGK
ncbi:MAG: YceH family protein [Pyrinomonadaceae bacterium MAG19_C2-C3]|nr:YceH family protein [Pyrinomonadaceae bacterium MAG19_C2-C3]